MRQESATSNTSALAVTRHADGDSPLIAEASFASGRAGLETRRLLQQAAQTPAGDININQGHTA